MKKILAIGLLIIMTTFASNAQKIYSKQNLEKASLEDLNLYLNKAKKTRKTGTIMTIVGPIAFVGGSALVLNLSNDPYAEQTETEVAAGVVLINGGMISTAVGLPLLITGSSRVKRINRIKNAKFNGVTMEFTPCNFYNYQAKSHQSGLTLRVKF
jgi:hypothetical protein